MSFDLKIASGDLSIGADGDFERVEDNEKLIQDVLKIILTPLGSNKFYNWYGCLINKSLIGQAYFDFELLTNVASSQLQNSIETLQRLQQKQSVEQKTSPYELIAAIRNITIERNITDPRFFSVTVSIATRAFSSVSVDFEVNPLS